MRVSKAKLKGAVVSVAIGIEHTLAVLIDVYEPSQVAND